MPHLVRVESLSAGQRQGLRVIRQGFIHIAGQNAADAFARVVHGRSHQVRRPFARHLENEFAGKTLRVSDGFRLFVPATLLENAREILNSPVSDEELIAQAEAEPAPESEGEESD